jgi:hypothetical protein
VGSILTIQLNEHHDSFIWTASRNFSVKNMYNDLVKRNGIHFNCCTWKAKIPLKIKIFLWYLRKGVILTKDNLAKRQWKGCTRCCFCNKQEIAQHLFFECPMAKLLWMTISITFGIRTPANCINLFGPWLRSFSNKQRNQVLIGVAAFCWALWLCRNEVVFQRSNFKTILQVIFRGAFWIRSRSILSKEEERNILKQGCRWLETMALEFFNKSGWNVRKRIMD